VDTLESLGARHGPDAVFFLLMGSDQALEFRRWRRWRRVLELATPAVMLRPPHTPESFRRDLEAEWEPAEVRRWLGWTLDIPRLDIHATDLRRRLERREDVESRLHDDVLRYIREHGLYRSGPPQKTALAT
jgi:nicotinate-nucleotide adenylyltransferase